MSPPRPIGFWVKTVDELIDAHFGMAAADAGITRRQWQILNVLAEREGAARNEVATALAPFLATGETIDTHITGLSALVAVAGDHLELTGAGRERLDQVRARSVQQLRDRVAAGLTREDYDTTLWTLERIARNLGWSETS
jgi:DNA-binding MarR family transcriptional regulator